MHMGRGGVGVEEVQGGGEGGQECGERAWKFLKGIFIDVRNSSLINSTGLRYTVQYNP